MQLYTLAKNFFYRNPAYHHQKARLMLVMNRSRTTETAILALPLHHGATIRVPLNDSVLVEVS